MRNSQWMKTFPPSLAVSGLALALWAWRAETASAPERVWVWLASVSLGVALWGLAGARRTQGWVSDEQDRHSSLDYSSAAVVAQTHVVTHGALALAQLVLLAFGGFSALTAPVSRGAPISPVGYALTVALFAVEALLTALNIWLVWRREVLIQRVIAIGGD